MPDHTNKQGLTSQQLATGVTTNSSSYQNHGSPIPEHTRPGFYGPGRPFGNNSMVVIQRGEDNAVLQLQAVSSPDGTAGGTGSYPNISGANAVVNPLTAPAWNGQTSPGESQQLVVTSASQLPSGVHGSVYGGATLAATGGLPGAAKTWALAKGSSLPAGLSLSAGGLISGTPSTAGSYTMYIRCSDSSGMVGTKLFTIAVS